MLRVARVDDDVDRRVRRRARLPRPAAVAADLDVGRLGLDGDQLVADDLELVVVGLFDALDARPGLAVVASSGSGRGSRAGCPPAGGRRPAGRRARRSAPRGCPRRCRPRVDPVSFSASLAPGADAEERRPGADHDRPVAGVDRDGVDRRAARAPSSGGGAVVSAGGAVASGATVSVAGGAGASALGCSASLAAARQGQRGDHARAREQAVSAHSRTSRGRRPSRSRRAGGRTKRGSA